MLTEILRNSIQLQPEQLPNKWLTIKTLLQTEHCYALTEDWSSMLLAWTDIIHYYMRFDSLLLPLTKLSPRDASNSDLVFILLTYKYFPWNGERQWMPALCNICRMRIRHTREWIHHWKHSMDKINAYTSQVTNKIFCVALVLLDFVRIFIVRIWLRFTLQYPQTHKYNNKM